MLSGSSLASEARVGGPLHRAPGARCKMMKNWGMIGGFAAALAAGIYVLWGPMTERKKHKKGLVPGLLNLGNTCFMNSLLQSLSACPSFIHWLEEFTSEYQLEPKNTSHRSLSVNLLELLKALSKQETTEDEVLDASPLLEVLRTYRWQISSFEEQDAHELFHVLTSSLEDEKDHQPHVTHLFDVSALELPQNTDRQIHCRIQGVLNPIPRQWKTQHPFHGRLTSNMICKHCQHQSPMRYDTFDSLSLSIPSASWGCAMTLENCLQHFISTESVKDVVCENCTKLPQCLCIHLQRLSWSNQGSPLKRNEHVQFSEFLALDRYKYRLNGNVFRQRQCATREGTNQTTEASAGSDGHHNSRVPLLNGTYSAAILSSHTNSKPSSAECTSYLFRLMAVIIHHGDMHSGHFVTYRRSPPAAKTPKHLSQHWLWVSDDTVRRANIQEVLSSNAYLLFYERVQSKSQVQGCAIRAEE
ncbi:ubiquitin carboxyl-terminal hydrolase 30 isoform X2 [Dendrobates tinctorius]|uniref:ubiquitin carboxyl-terminal hydrolase 30 isoform X2 n=1 Tax=Dendrobates tinctorius TaxID=92724 RepID=UPI003CC9792F